VQRKQVTVDNVLNQIPLNIRLCRTLTESRWSLWLKLVQRLMSVQLNNAKGVFVWGLTTYGAFTVKSMYLDLLDDNIKYLKKYIWKMKVPLKIKVLMWFLHRKVLLTKDNLIKRNWTSNEKCYFCDNKESIHLFFDCPLPKVIWRIVHMSFGLAPPKNVTKFFGNWLKGISKKDLIQIRLGVCAMVLAIWNTRNDFVFNKPKKKLFPAGYPHGYPLDSYVVLFPTREATGSDGFWVQPFRDGSSGFIQSVRLTITS
jgi:hypothetical protein